MKREGPVGGLKREMKVHLTIAACLALAACAETANQTSRALIAPGNYFWSTDAGCATLTWQVNSTITGYTWDDGCNESVEYTAQSVTLDGNVLHIDAATMVIEKAGSNGFEGQWTLFDFTSHAVFEEAEHFFARQNS